MCSCLAVSDQLYVLIPPMFTSSYCYCRSQHFQDISCSLQPTLLFQKTIASFLLFGKKITAQMLSALGFLVMRYKKCILPFTFVISFFLMILQCLHFKLTDLVQFVPETSIANTKAFLDTFIKSEL